MNMTGLASQLSAKTDAKVLVVGDLMLDAYLMGTVTRISPEAPVPVLAVKNKNQVLGGAANVALNCQMLGLKVYLAGVSGLDETAKTLRNLLDRAGIHTDALVCDNTRPTTLKTRIVATGQQIVRIDEEVSSPLSLQIESELIAACERALSSHPDVVVISDYGKGVVTPKVAQAVIKSATNKNIPVLCDPKGSDYSKYKGATIISPNRTELALATRVSEHQLSALIEAGQQMCTELQVNNIVFTRSEEGISLLSASDHTHFSATAREVVDVCGAGDAVISALAFGIARKLSRESSVYLGNVAGGLAVQKFGTAAVSREELLAECQRLENVQETSKIQTFEAAKKLVSRWKESGETVVFTNGCFDLFHVGHLKLLESCKAKGTKLIVGVNSDESVRTLKGPTRPVVPEDQRLQVLAGLHAVDAVVLFEEETPLQLIESFKPDVLAKGGDYTIETVVGSRFVSSYGGRVELIPLVEGISTSALVKNILQRNTNG